ncbi:MAG: NAD(P)H-dependent oxidoreductase [Candidatus Margulisbacteria bacterium]|nr:NAD(P)H-dependent oxidoreductase [Candidatus Margulisiibacteriota bacterium]
MYLPVILGTAREGRESEKVARFVLELVKRSGAGAELIDARDYRIAATNNTGAIPEAKKLAEKITKADGIIIVMPEYNHGFSGELKMMLDLLYKEYANKPVAICGVSAGPLGGARGVQALKLTLLALRLQPILETVYFPNVQELFNEQGEIKDRAYEQRVLGMVEGLVKQIANKK